MEKERNCGNVKNGCLNRVTKSKAFWKTYASKTDPKNSRYERWFCKMDCLKEYESHENPALINNEATSTTSYKSCYGGGIC